MMRMLILEKSKRVESVRNHKSIKVTTVYLKRDEMRPIKGVIQSLSDLNHAENTQANYVTWTTDPLRYDSV